MRHTHFSRRLDSNGRLVIPVRLREELGLQVGHEYTFYTHEQNGKTYLCIECSKGNDELENAKRLLEAAGYEIG